MSSAVVLERPASGGAALAHLADGTVHPLADHDAFVAFVRDREADDDVRWVWDSTPGWYQGLLDAGVRVRRCHDLRLTRNILRASELAAPDSALLAPLPVWEEWDGGWGSSPPIIEPPQADALFAIEPDATLAQVVPRDVTQQWRLQQEVLDAVAARAPSSAHRLRLLVAAESSGALAAVELHHDGLPFRRDLHERQLELLLGARGPSGHRPQRLEALVARIRELLGAPTLNPDSLPYLLRELRRNGLDVTSTNQWELRGQDHPVIEPLLEYKKLARLASANGWAWLDAWVSDGRFRSEFVPGGVVTGRWSSRGGGALSLPKVIRGAVRADPGWRLVVVDAAQLEPRILAAMSHDDAMLRAGAKGDLYAALVDEGVVEDRAHAKVGMLGVLYGSTTGTSAVLVPRLARAFPRAMGLVEHAARTGEAGGIVTTWLGRSSPKPSATWHQEQAAASDVSAGAAEESRARSRAREWGRFTRNFVVQGTAAEWVLAWLAGVRLGLRELDGEQPNVSFFLHDELVIHTPQRHVEAVRELVVRSARDASRLLFPHLDVDPLVPLDVVVALAYDEVDAPAPASAAVVEGDLGDAAGGAEGDDDAVSAPTRAGR